MRALLLIVVTFFGAAVWAYGQECSVTSSAPTVRAEGRTELVGDLVLTCSTIAVGTFDLYVNLNNSIVPITSRTGEDQVTVVDGFFATTYSGQLNSDNVLQFTGMTVPLGTFQSTISGIRGDMSQTLNSRGFSPVEEMLSILSTPPGLFGGVSSLNNGPMVATAIAGLGQVTAVAGSVAACSASAGIPPGTVAPIPISIPENFSGAFKPQFGPPGSNSESGFADGLPGIAANSGTQFVVSFDQLAPGVTLYVPLTIFSEYAGAAQLVTTEGGIAPSQSSLTVGGVPLFAVTAAGSLIYNVTASDGEFQKSFTVPVYVGTSAGTLLTAAAATGYRVDLGPRSSVLPNAVPRFAALTAPGYQPLFAVTDCGPLSFTSSDGGNGLPQSVALNGTAGATYTATPSQTWITVSPATGTLPAQLSITTNPSGLAAGSYSGAVQITSVPAGATPASIPVQLTIAAAAQLTLNPTSLAFADAEADPGSIQLAPQAIAVSGLAEGTPFLAEAEGSPWLSIGQSGSANSGALAVSVNPAGLSPGTYYGIIKVTSGNLAVNIPVSFTLTNGIAIGVSSQALVFLSQTGSIPAPQIIASTHYASTPTSNAAWLTASNDTVLFSAIDVSANPAGLAPGTYHAVVTLTSYPAAPVQIPVTLQVGAIAATPVLSTAIGAATYSNVGLSPGEIITLFGLNLGPQTGLPLTLNSFGTVSTLLGDTQVFANGIPCPLLFAGASQINAVLPYELSGQGDITLQVAYLGVLSEPVTVPGSSALPGLFTADASGGGPVAAINQDGTINSASNPAPGGSVVALFGSGGGPINPLMAAGSITLLQPPFPLLTLPTVVNIGGAPALVTYAGAAPGLVNGVMQINATVPTGLSSGSQALNLSVGGNPAQDSLILYVK